MNLGVGISNVLPYLETSGLLILVVIAARLYIENRRLRLQERADDRDGYGVLIKALQDDVLHVRREHRECQERLSRVEQQLEGVHRQLVLHSSMGAVSMGAPSEHVTGAAERAVRAVSEKMAEDTKKPEGE